MVMCSVLDSARRAIPHNCTTQGCYSLDARSRGSIPRSRGSSDATPRKLTHSVSDGRVAAVAGFYFGLEEP